jgi:hypothetical protein
MGDGRSRRAFTMSDGAFKVQAQASASWSKVPEVRVQVSAHLKHLRSEIPVTLVRNSIDYRKLRADILDAAESLGRQTA